MTVKNLESIHVISLVRPRTIFPILTSLQSDEVFNSISSILMDVFSSHFDFFNKQLTLGQSMLFM
jgi:hypothetical protein